MDERKKQVLNAIIKDYVANAEPVGSRTITKKYDLGVSPATIRNEMSDLTDDGYIEQPHTSAGRIPSGKGYRFYVDHLMERHPLTEKEAKQVREVVRGDISDIDEFMRSCVNMLSRLSNYAAIAAVPEQGHGKVENIQLVLLNDHQVLAVIQASTGIIRHKLMELPMPINQQQLALVEDALVKRLKGAEMRSVSYALLNELLTDYQTQAKMAEQALSLLDRLLTPDTGRRIFTGGFMNMLSQPEFRDIDKLRSIFSLLEENAALEELLDASQDSGQSVQVTIGNEMPVEGAKDCSLVVANYFVNGEKAGSIGVLGPTRMSYGKTVSLMEYVAKELTKALRDKSSKS